METGPLAKTNQVTIAMMANTVTIPLFGPKSLLLISLTTCVVERPNMIDKTAAQPISIARSQPNTITLTPCRAQNAAQGRVLFEAPLPGWRACRQCHEGDAD